MPRIRVLKTQSKAEPSKEEPKVDPGDVGVQEGIFENQEEGKTDFWLFMQQATPAEWDRENYSVCLYRADGGDARRPRGQRYLELICRPFTIEDIRARYGGGSCMCSGEPHGHYRYMMTGKAGRLLYSGEFSVEGPGKVRVDTAQTASSPNLPVTDPSLKEEMTKLRYSLNQMHEREHTDGRPDLSSIAVNKLIEMIQQSSPKPASISELMSAMKSMQGDAGMGSLPQTISLLKDLGLVNPNPIAQLGALVEGLKNIGIPIGDGGAATPVSAWASAASQIVPQLAKAAESVSGNIAAAKHEERLALEARIRAAQGFPAEAVPVPAAIAAPAAQAPAPPNNEPSDAWLRQKIVDQVKRDRTGEELGDWIDQISPQIIEQLKPLSVDQVIEWMKADPILTGAIAHPRLRQTITELLEYANSTADEVTA